MLLRKENLNGFKMTPRAEPSQNSLVVEKICIYSFIRMLATNHMVSMNVSATMNHPSTKKVSSIALFSTMDSFGLIRSGSTYWFIRGTNNMIPYIQAQ